MRCFVAVWPPAPVVAAVRELDRPPRDGVRWTTPEQWHVTLRFLGELDGAAPVLDALASTPLPGAEAVLGPAVVAIGPRVLAVPVAGLEELAQAVATATAPLGGHEDARPFSGHLTLARTRRARVRGLTGARLAARFAVHDVTVVRSHLGPSGARYEVIGAVPVGRPDPGDRGGGGQGDGESPGP